MGKYTRMTCEERRRGGDGLAGLNLPERDAAQQQPQGRRRVRAWTGRTMDLITTALK